jgi:hypothetical protein
MEQDKTPLQLAQEQLQRLTIDLRSMTHPRPPGRPRHKGDPDVVFYTDLVAKAQARVDKLR